MQGYSAIIPLTYDKSDGSYALNKTLVATVKQNFKMLVLTNPGERIMIPDFGVGLRALLFNQDNRDLRNNIRLKLEEQIRKYMNFIVVEQLDISEPNSNDENLIFVRIKYSINNLNVSDILNIQL